MAQKKQLYVPISPGLGFGGGSDKVETHEMRFSL